MVIIFTVQSIETLGNIKGKSSKSLEMDVKSLARSKRAHSQHHQSKKPHHTPKSKAPAVASPREENGKKQTGKQTKEKPLQFHSSQSNLPSNWNRYVEEMESGSEDPATDSASRASDVVVPKSKGADFRHLISEAQSQLQSQSIDASGRFVSFDDSLPDFNQGISSMLSVRGNSILSWIGEDNFNVDDKSSASYDASFLSMDLHAVAAQLEKVNISKRLFIEADLLPPELYLEESKEAETCGEAEENTDSKSEAMPSENASKRGSFPCEGTGTVNQETMSSTAVGSRSSVISPSDRASFISSAEDKSKQFDQTILRNIVDTIAQLNIDPVSVSNEKKVPAFKALDAEAELDMLLNSFGQTELPDSSVINKKPNNIFPVAKQDESGSVFEITSSLHASQPLGHGANSSKSIPSNVNLDDTIDDLLTELSNLKNQEDVSSVYTNQKPLGQGPNSSKRLDLTVDLDETIDSLLEEAPNLQKKEDPVIALEAKDTPTNIPIPSSQSTTKLLDDFDSWLDTI